MAQAVLQSAFVWECSECGSRGVVMAKTGRLDADCAAVIDEAFETLDATVSPDGELFESPHVVSRVLIGPAFVQCESCGKMHAATLPELADDEGEDDGQ
jgi:hypothetical protein